MYPSSKKAINIVPDGEHRMVENHTRSGVTHDTANLLPHGRFVTMHRTDGTGRLLRAKCAFVDTLYCVGKELQAVGAKSAAPVMAPTVNFNHEADSPAFSVQTFPSLSLVN